MMTIKKIERANKPDLFKVLEMTQDMLAAGRTAVNGGKILSAHQNRRKDLSAPREHNVSQNQHLGSQWPRWEGGGGEVLRRPV